MPAVRNLKKPAAKLAILFLALAAAQALVYLLWNGLLPFPPGGA
jgi:hypothetical protein